MEPNLNVRHLNTIYAMKKEEQREYLAAVREEYEACPITHLSSEWGILEDLPWETEEELEEKLDALLAGMTLREKIGQMSADIPPKLYKVLYPRYNCRP